MLEGVDFGVIIERLLSMNKVEYLIVLNLFSFGFNFFFKIFIEKFIFYEEINKCIWLNLFF